MVSSASDSSSVSRRSPFSIDCCSVLTTNSPIPSSGSQPRSRLSRDAAASAPVSSTAAIRAAHRTRLYVRFMWILLSAGSSSSARSTRRRMNCEDMLSVSRTGRSSSSSSSAWFSSSNSSEIRISAHLLGQFVAQFGASARESCFDGRFIHLH